MTALLAFENVTKRYGSAQGGMVILDRASFEFELGDLAGVYGEPRTGKSTLLRLAAGIELPDAGDVRYLGRAFTDMRDAERALVLRRSIGFAPSAADPWLCDAGHAQPVLEYVALPLISDGQSTIEASHHAREALELVAATDCAHVPTYQLSAAERTRVSLARALARRPQLLLIDEPAAAQSPTARDDIRDILQTINRERRIALVVASDDLGVLRACRTLLSIGGGEVVSSQRPATVIPFPDHEGRSGSARP